MNHPNCIVKRKYMFFIIILWWCVSAGALEIDGVEYGGVYKYENASNQPAVLYCRLGSTDPIIESEKGNSTLTKFEIVWKFRGELFCRYDCNLTTKTFDLAYYNTSVIDIDPNDSNVTHITVKNLTILHTGEYECAAARVYWNVHSSNLQITVQSFADKVMVFQIPNRQPKIDIISIRKANSSIFYIYANCTVWKSYPAASIEWSIGAKSLNADAVQSSVFPEKIEPNPKKVMLTTNVSTLKTNITSEMFHKDQLYLRCTATMEPVKNYPLYNDFSEIKVIKPETDGATELSMNH